MVGGGHVRRLTRPGDGEPDRIIDLLPLDP
jgi:hypothetical protein